MAVNNLSTEMIIVSEPFPHVVHVELARKPVNAFSSQLWEEFGSVFSKLCSYDGDIRVCVLSSQMPKVFSAGLEVASTHARKQVSDPGRKAMNQHEWLRTFQNAILSPEKCPFPVIAACHGAVIGLAIDIISSCDIRYAASDASFCVKEVDLGLAADLGALSYLPKITGNHSLLRELVFTARSFSVNEAEKIGLLSRVIPGSRNEVVSAALDLAKTIASKSPVAVAGSKRFITHARDHTVPDSLEYTALWNGAALEAEDVAESVASLKQKRKPKYEPLKGKLAISTGVGFALTKADIFPPIAARGIGQIILNVTIPALMFSKIIPAFSVDNIHVLGPLIFVACLYHAIGLVFALIIKQIFWIPHRFRHGFIAAGIFGNVGDIPTSVLMSLTGSAPFGGSDDQTLAVAYISAFIFIFLLLLFPFGGHHLLSADFAGTDVEPEEVRMALRNRHNGIILRIGKLFRRHSGNRTPVMDSPEKFAEENRGMDNAVNTEISHPDLAPRVSDSAIQRTKHVSFRDEIDSESLAGGTLPLASPSTSWSPSRFTSPTATIVEQPMKIEPQVSPFRQHIDIIDSQNGDPSSTPVDQPRKMNRRLSRLRTFLRSLMMPSSLTILVCFPVAIISPLKGLFVPVEEANIPNAPDGEPPLAFIMDAAEFIGAASVPLGLISLGSALARLRFPRGDWQRKLPFGAIISLAVARMLILPIIGVVVCRALVHIDFISRSDKVLQLVCLFLSCLPTATTLVTVTQVYSGTGEAEHLAAFLIPQYIMMFVCMPAIIFYTLQLLF